MNRVSDWALCSVRSNSLERRLFCSQTPPGQASLCSGKVPPVGKVGSTRRRSTVRHSLLQLRLGSIESDDLYETR